MNWSLAHPLEHLIMGCISHPSMRLAGCCTWLSIWLCPAAVAEVWVVTDQKHPITVAAPVRLIELDAPARLQAQLNAQLTTDPAQAAAIARTSLAQLTEAWQELVDAWHLGVHTVPAVVVDRRYVVYGTTDVDAALFRIDTFRQQQL